MADLNQVTLLGRVGNDPELKSSAQGRPYLRISLATHGPGKNGEERTTHWHRVVVFGEQAEVCAKYVKAGALILVEGSLEVRVYSPEEGRKVTHVSVIARRVQFSGLASRGAGSDAATSSILSEANEEVIAEAC